MPSPVMDRAMDLARVDLSPRHRGPRAVSLAVATVASLVLCLLADWLLARAAVAVFPATKGYAHFQFSDYCEADHHRRHHRVQRPGRWWPADARPTRGGSSSGWPSWSRIGAAGCRTPYILDARPARPRRWPFLVVMHLAIAVITV